MLRGKAVISKAFQPYLSKFLYVYYAAPLPGGEGMGSNLFPIL